MIPISDNIFFFSNKRPIIVYGLIGLNLIVFLWEIKLEISNELTNLIYSWGMIHKQITAAFAELLAGNLAAIIIIAISLFSLFVAMFLHSSFSQILGNLLFLWVFGQTIEKILGYRRFILFYFLESILTALIQILADPNLAVPLIGNNSAIAAILGAYVIKFPQTKIDSVLPLLVIFIPIQIPAFFYLFWWFIQQLFYGIGSLNITGGVNPPSLGYWMHGAGFIIGATYMKILQRIGNR